jgi:hypothetical protein
MMFESWEERALKSDREQAFRLGAEVALPARTRSITKAEAMASDGGRAAIMYLLTMLVPLIVSAMMLQSNASVQSKVAWIVMVGIVTAGLYYLSRSVQQRRSAYVDPEIVVEVGKDGVTIRNPAGTHKLPDHGLRYEFVHYSHDSSVTFLGIKLETPLGVLELHDQYYPGARQVAAAIVLRAEREKVEGGFVQV